MSTHLELYLDLLKGLPTDFTREFNLIGALDQKVEDAKQEIRTLEQEIQSLCAQRARLSREDHRILATKLLTLRQKQKIIHSLGEEKVSIVDQAQLMVQTFADKLREEMMKFARELDQDVIQQIQDEEHAEQQRQMSMSQSSLGYNSSMHATNVNALSSTHLSTHGGYSRGMTSNSNFTIPASTMHSRKRGYEEENSSYSQYSQYANAPTPTNADQSSSSTYCTCGRTDGDDADFIGCDNDNCRIQWYHLACVGLKVLPKGEWFCPECRSQGYALKNNK